jgi:hypothetical protein
MALERETNLVQKCHHLKQYTAMRYAAFPERALGVYNDPKMANGAVSVVVTVTMDAGMLRVLRVPKTTLA